MVLYNEEMEVTVSSRVELGIEARAFVARLTPRTEGATFVTLSGELGAGKTAFVQEVAEILGVSDTVTSPTFVLEKVYALPDGSLFERLVHIDAYRLEGATALAPLGFDNIMQDARTLVMLEWPERVRDGMRDADVSITITTQTDGTRTIVYG